MHRLQPYAISSSLSGIMSEMAIYRQLLKPAVTPFTHALLTVTRRPYLPITWRIFDGSYSLGFSPSTAKYFPCSFFANSASAREVSNWRLSP